MNKYGQPSMLATKVHGLTKGCVPPTATQPGLQEGRFPSKWTLWWAEKKNQKRHTNWCALQLLDVGGSLVLGGFEHHGLHVLSDSRLRLSPHTWKHNNYVEPLTNMATHLNSYPPISLHP